MKNLRKWTALAAVMAMTATLFTGCGSTDASASGATAPAAESTAATTTETGKKERVCERCDYKETAVISMISNEEQPTTSTKSDTAVKTGDSTNILLWSMVTVISLAGVITLLFFKRRKCR